jgi:histidine ammonia-lyase
MATFAARRLHDMADNTAAIVGIELLAAAQGIDFHAPSETSAPLKAAMRAIRRVAPPYAEDRFFAPDIAAAAALVESGDIGTQGRLGGGCLGPRGEYTA